MGCSMASQQVHPTAIVHANAQIGKDVEIGPYAIIEEHVVIGDRCRIDAHAVIKDYTRMGVATISIPTRWSAANRRISSSRAK